MSKHLACFLDLDGTLVEFMLGALRQHSRELPYHEVRWNFHEQLGMTHDEFWVPLGFEFWRDLDWCADGREILRVVEDIFEPSRIAILSDPGQRPGVDDGKRAWIRRHLPQYATRVFLGTEKHIIAGHGKFLIDDHDPNVEAFRVAGKAVLVPRPWNSRRDVISSEGRFDLDALANELLALVRGE